jgi:hypothetical protein
MIQSAKPMRAGKKFSNETNVIWAVQSPMKKTFLFFRSQITPIFEAIPVPPKGAYHDRRETRGSALIDPLPASAVPNAGLSGRG